MPKITEATTIKEILKTKKGREILEKYQLPCLSCPVAKLEIENLKIGQVCKIYGLPLEKILKELTQKLE